jgi:type I restriction enzyme M protein
VEEGLLAEAIVDDKISKSLAAARLKVAQRDGSDPDEVNALKHIMSLYETEAAATKAVKDAHAALAVATLKKYGELTEADVQGLVLDDKWAASIRSRVTGEVNTLTLGLVSRIQQLGERYAETVGAIDAELQQLEAKVADHLAAIGVER